MIWPVLKSKPKYKLSNVVQFGMCDDVEQLSMLKPWEGCLCQTCVCLCLSEGGQVNVC